MNKYFKLLQKNASTIH